MRSEDGHRPPAGALLRRPAMMVRQRVLAALRDAGFDDVQAGHLAVFQHPGPEGCRPGVIARRAELSKQAMNHLLSQLEERGYLTREQQDGDRRTRVVRLTGRGHAVMGVVTAAIEDLEREWADLLGASAYDDLRDGLARLSLLLEDEAS